MNTLSELSARSGIAASTLRSYVEGRREPKLPARQIGKTWVVSVSDWDKWLAAYRALPKRGRRT
jgi:hypothetical protein